MQPTRIPFLTVEEADVADAVVLDFMGVTMLNPTQAATLFSLVREELNLRPGTWQNPLEWTCVPGVAGVESDATGVGWTIRTPFLEITFIRRAADPESLMVMRQRSERFTQAIANLIRQAEVT